MQKLIECLKMEDFVVVLFSSNHLNYSTITTVTYIFEKTFDATNLRHAKFDIERLLEYDL